MRVEWHGQSAFTLTADGTKVFIDPFGDMSGLARDRRNEVRLSADPRPTRSICC